MVSIIQESWSAWLTISDFDSHVVVWVSVIWQLDWSWNVHFQDVTPCGSQFAEGLSTFPFGLLHGPLRPLHNTVQIPIEQMIQNSKTEL
jgi:hypothetical protein